MADDWPSIYHSEMAKFQAWYMSNHLTFKHQKQTKKKAVETAMQVMGKMAYLSIISIFAKGILAQNILSDPTHILFQNTSFGQMI